RLYAQAPHASERYGKGKSSMATTQSRKKRLTKNTAALWLISPPKALCTRRALIFDQRLNIGC
ncbi:MAG: hypothetical protein FWD53_05500, partial [Phycisphaerales bacterium]|nr:hypothetical protein [Phycisphaerales bacterium]